MHDTAVAAIGGAILATALIYTWLQVDVKRAKSRARWLRDYYEE